MEGQQGSQSAQGKQSGQAILTYIGEQLRAGYSEASLRQHLETHGWSGTAVNEVFEQYHRSAMPAPQPLTAAVRKYRPRIPKWTKTRFIKLGVSFAAATVLAVGTYVFWPQAAPQRAAVQVSLAYKQKQSRDIVLLAGVITQFLNQYDGKVPTHIVQSDSNSLMLCDAACNPQTPNFSMFTSYKADNVLFVPYSSGLMAPDKDTMYIVTGSTCRSATELGEQSVNPRSMVILYARVEDGGKLVQRCVTL